MSPPAAGAPGGSSEMDEETLQINVQEDMARLEVLRDQLTALLREQELLRVSLDSHLRAQKTLEAMDQLGTDRELLLPVGAETFVSALPRKTDSVLIGIGRGYVAELGRDKALEVLTKRREQLEKGDHSLLQQLRRIEGEAAQVQGRLQLVYQEAQRASEGAVPPAPGPARSGKRAAPRSA